MPQGFSRKRLQDKQLFKAWAEGDQAKFARLGISREKLQALAASFQGQIILPDNPAYDADRKLFNPVFDDYPIMILYCVVPNDVALALEAAKQTTVPFQVRSGGHCTAGFSAGSGVLIDVSQLNSIYVDPAASCATVGVGVNFGNFRKALAPYGLHVPGGECDDVCIGGYMQGGGYGFTSVSFGMNCDNVLSATVLLADGSFVVASNESNPDLFWGIRGGTGGTFGIVIDVTYQLRPLGDVLGWAVIWPLSNPDEIANATNAMLLLQDRYMDTAPSARQNIQVSLCYQPGIEGGLPLEPLYPYLMVRGVYVGSQEAGLADIAPLCNAPGATLQWTNYTDFDTLNTNLLNVPYGMPCFPENTPMPNEDKASRIVASKWSADDWMALFDYYVSTPAPNPYSYFYMEFYCGAINARPVGFNAFAHRTALYNAVMDVFWWQPEDRAAAEAYLEGWMAFMESRYNGEAYQNYPRLDDPDYRYKYWANSQYTLRAVKLKYDPQLWFTFAQCIVVRDCDQEPTAEQQSQIPQTLRNALAAPIVRDPQRVKHTVR